MCSSDLVALGAFATAIVAFMALRALGIGPAGSLFASGRLSRRDPVMLIDFRTTNADSTLGRVVAEAVRAGLAGSTTFALVPPAAIPAALVRMKRDAAAPVDAGLARQIAVREGFKAIIDGEVTGLAGGYIVSVKLVRADSGIELTSFRETGDGPRGLIDAADRLARALRAKAGESLRTVNASPPLFQATTSSLDALRRYSDAVRANALDDPRSVDMARDAIAIDSTFASAWSALAGTLANYGGSQAAIDSAITRAYRLRDRLPPLERDDIAARYFSLGPGHDTRKAIEAYESTLRRGDTVATTLSNLGEQYRRMREYAKAEALNLAAWRMNPTAAGTPLGNAIEMQINQGKFDSAAANIPKLARISPIYALGSTYYFSWARGEPAGIKSATDSLMRPDVPAFYQDFARDASRGLALYTGQLGEARRLSAELARGALARVVAERIKQEALEIVVRGPTPASAKALDEAVAQFPYLSAPIADRPYLDHAEALARAGLADRARALVARYRTDVTDTALRRWKEPALHHALGEVALAANLPREALAEFRRSDLTTDGSPASECAACVAYDLGRAFDAAGQRDSAAVMFERYLATPYYQRSRTELDPTRVPAIRERLGQIYDALGKPDQAAPHHRAFIALWKNADAELQPRVAEARRRLAKAQKGQG